VIPPGRLPSLGWHAVTPLVRHPMTPIVW
jgi:hypothetical protein